MESILTQRSPQTLIERVNDQVSLLINGKPLDAFDRYFGTTVRMFANDAHFASSAAEGRRKQEPYIAAAVTITGSITDLKMIEEQNICVFRNRSRFVTSDDTEHQIDGLCWQKWEDGYVAEERYYDGALMQKLILDGVLENPAIMKTHIETMTSV